MKFALCLIVPDVFVARLLVKPLVVDGVFVVDDGVDDVALVDATVGVEEQVGPV